MNEHSLLTSNGIYVCASTSHRIRALGYQSSVPRKLINFFGSFTCDIGRIDVWALGWCFRRKCQDFCV
jgi:hypothetical protein